MGVVGDRGYEGEERVRDGERIRSWAWTSDIFQVIRVELPDLVVEVPLTLGGSSSALGRQLLSLTSESLASFDPALSFTNVARRSATS